VGNRVKVMLQIRALIISLRSIWSGLKIKETKSFLNFT
jgi:hypothetical protein